MPVFMEYVQLPSSQDRIDLEKIYADAPAWLFPPYQNADELLQHNLDRGVLVAARFNQRLLGAAILQKNTDLWLVSHLCVREVTRMRGVARRLLDELQREAAASGAGLAMLLPNDQPELQTLAGHLGIAWRQL